MAAGFGEAMAAYLSQGGSIRTNKRGSRFMKGPLRGKTLDEGVEQGKRMWAGTTDGIREKYASRAAEGRFAPSEAIKVKELRDRLNSGQTRDSGADDMTRATDAVGGRGAAPPPPDDGNMDDEVAAATTPEMRADMAAQLEQGRGMATASYGRSPMFMGMLPTQEQVDRGRRNAAIRSGAADPSEFNAVDEDKAAREQREREARGAEAAARRQGNQERQRERAGLPAQPPAVDDYMANQEREAESARQRISGAGQNPPAMLARPAPAAAPAPAAQEFAAPLSMAQQAHEAGYVGNDAQARFARDQAAGKVVPNAANPPAMLARPAPASAPSPRQMDIRRGQAANAPGAQRDMVMRRDAERRKASGEKSDIERGRELREYQWAQERQRRAGEHTPSGDEIRGLGKFAAWGINPNAQTEDDLQLKGSHLPAIRENPAFRSTGFPPVGRPQPRRAFIPNRR